MDSPINRIDVLDLRKRQWVEKVHMPDNVAQSHVAIASDGKRFIYLVSGQLGPRCSPAIPDSFAYDTHKMTWHFLPPLPEPRYAATMQLWGGRLHVVGGSMPDRYTPAADHWSMAVYQEKAKESQWQREPPIPKGGCHRASAIVDGRFYVVGGQEGDFTAIKGSLIYECTHKTQETYHGELYSIGPGDREWQRLPDTPVPSSHTEFSVMVIGRSIVLFGGQVYKQPETYRLELTDVIQAFDTATGTWTIRGHLPYRVKSATVAYDEGWIYAMVGQRDRSPRDASPGQIVEFAWRARLPLD